MASDASINKRDDLQVWQDRWETGHTAFHRSIVNESLIKYLDQLIPDEKAQKIFVPLCGKTLDMKMFADKGLTVIGVDGIRMPLEQFFLEHGLDSKVESVTSNGANIQIFKSSDEKIRLYCCNIKNFPSELEGHVDAVWDRGSLVALNREDVSWYVSFLKKLVRPGGRVLVEVLEYNVSIFDDRTSQYKPPPPFPMFEQDLRQLYEPEFSVRQLQRQEDQFSGESVHSAQYLLIRQ